MVRQTAKTITFEIFGGLLVLLLLAAGALAYRLSTGPMELSIFKDDIAGALSRARDGRNVTLDKVQLEWSPSERRVYVTATDLVFFDDDNKPAARAARADIVLDATSLLFGKVEPLRLSLHEGVLDVSRTDTGWLIAGEPLAAAPLVLGETPEEWLAAINQSLVQLLAGLRESRDALQLETVSFDDFEVSLKLGEGAPLTISKARGQLGRLDGIKLIVSGQGSSAGLPTGLAFDVTAPADFSEIAVELGFSDWPLEALAARLGVKEGVLSGLPADFSVAFTASETAGLDRIKINTTTGEGALQLGETAVGVRELELTSEYLAADDRLIIDATRLDAGVVDGAAILTIEAAMKGGNERDWRLESDGLALDFQPRFDRVWNFSSVSASGAVSLDERRINLARAAVKVGGGTLKTSGIITLPKETEPGELPFSLDLTGEAIGPLTRQDVLTFWPVGLGSGARNYVLNNIQEVTLTDATVKVEIEPDSFADEYLPDDALTVNFSVTDVVTRFMSDLPAVTEASGTGRVTGNSFTATLGSGKFDTWELDEGIVEFPAFNPKGGDFRVFARGRGEARDLVRVISDSRLQLQETTGFNPDDVSGQGSVNFEMFRPALDNVTYDQMRFNVTGNIRGGGFAQAALGFDLTDASARIDMDESNLTISGFGQLGPAPVQFTWRDGINDGDNPATLSASAVVDHDVLNQFGILGRAYMTGEIPIEIQAILRGKGVATADASLDLQEARLDIPEIGWIKPAGEPAKASVTYTETDGQPSTSVKLETETAILDGDIRLGENNRIVSADLRRAYLKGSTDVRGTIRRLADDSLAISLSGPLLDLSDALGEVGALTSGSGGIGGAMTLDAEVETLRLRSGLDMKQARVALISANDKLQSLIASGKTIGGAAFETTYEASEASGATVSVTSDDAGFLTQAFLGADFLIGGELNLTGTLAHGDIPTKVLINISDARMKDAPFLTQILSLASLRGLADTLGGDGVLFSRIEVPLIIVGDRYVINGGKASGPALGLTANGWIGTEQGGINIDGVLVPSFGVNSALGGIPIIGDLVVGRDGEGIFSLAYSVRGTLERAQIAVNPLSGILPGVLRRIFENPAETEVPESSPGPINIPVSPMDALPEPEEIGGG